jgi:outer membrane protein assembly factor BamA
MSILNMSILRKKITILLLIMLALACGKTLSQQLLEVDEVNFKFKGKRTFEDGVLEDAVAITKAKVYKKDIVSEDILKLKKFYFDNGFFETEVDTSVALNYEDEEAVITFTITENQRYKIDSVLIIGIENVPQETLVKIHKIKTAKPGDYYSKVLVIQQENEILDSLQNNGFMNARLALDEGTVITRYKNEGLVKVEIQLEGADTIFYFGSTTIDIKDNLYGVRTEYPREEIVYKEGEIYSKARKLDSERNMSKISIISSAKLNPTNITGNRVDFTADINLNKKNEITPYIKGANFENRFYLGGGIRYLNKYFISGNRTLLLELEEDFNSPDINLTQLSATVTVPHFIARKITLIDKLSIGFNNVENYKNYFVANATTLNYFIAQHTFYNNAFLDLTEELIWIKYDTIATGRQTQFNSFLSITLEHDNTNNVLDPSSGFYHSILSGHSGLLPRVITGILGKNVFYSQFFKTYTLNKFYFNLSRKQGHTVFATAMKIGDIIEYGSGDNVIPVQPIYKFFSGGSSSVRGWNAKKNGMVRDRNLGGTFLFEGSFELRKKLFPGKEGFIGNLGAAFFFDYGNVWDSHKDFKFSEIALAVGFGIRYDLFIGPIRIDFGFKLFDPSQKDGEKWLFDDFTNNKLSINFGIGQAF